MRFFILCLSCYCLIISVFAYYSFPTLNLLQTLPSIWRMSFFEFLIAFNLYHFFRYRLLNKLNATQLKFDSFFSMFVVFGLNLFLIQFFFSFTEPVPLSITFAVFESLLQVLPDGVFSTISLLIIAFSGINLTLETMRNSHQQASF